MTIEERLEKAINYHLENADIDELTRHFYWYDCSCLEDLRHTMYESYLGNYEGKELEERIKMLYGV